MNRDHGVDDALPADARTVVPGRTVTYHNEPERKPMKKPSFKERGQAKLAPTKPSSATGPKQPPVVMQLPGGVTIKGFAFRITRLDSQGRAVEFELATGNEDSDCVLWATPTFLAQPLPPELKRRVLDRIEQSIEGQVKQEHNDPSVSFKQASREYPHGADDSDYANDEDLDEE